MMLKLKVEGCARCGEDHEGLIAKRLSNPHDEWTMWTMCPMMEEPVMLKMAPGFEGVVDADH